MHPHHSGPLGRRRPRVLPRKHPRTGLCKIAFSRSRLLGLLKPLLDVQRNVSDTLDAMLVFIRFLRDVYFLNFPQTQRTLTLIDLIVVYWQVRRALRLLLSVRSGFCLPRFWYAALSGEWQHGNGCSPFRKMYGRRSSTHMERTGHSFISFRGRLLPCCPLWTLTEQPASPIQWSRRD